MEWLPVFAMLQLVVGMGLVVWEAGAHSRGSRRTNTRVVSRNVVLKSPPHIGVSTAGSVDSLRYTWFPARAASEPRNPTPMARIDRVKEALGWLKVVFVTLVAIDVSLIAWFAQSLGNASMVLLFLAFFAIVGATAAVIGVNYAASKRIEELEKL